MSRLATSFVLGYHGCDRKIADKAIRGELDLTPSDADFDWLGPGIYFWEADPQRAMEWAIENRSGLIAEPAVVGAVIDLRNCLDLSARENLELISAAYDSFVVMQDIAGLPIPENKSVKGKPDNDRLLRYLDNAVIRHLHEIVGRISSAKLEPFDTVRGMFTEGEPAYPGAGYWKKSHVQIAVLNKHCIRGLFIPR